MMRKKKRIVVAGAGISGLTAGAYVLRGGHELLILEKSAECGGARQFLHQGRLSLRYGGPGPSAMQGILIPMLADLGIDLPMVKGEVSTGIKDRIVHYETDSGIEDFLLCLRDLFPECTRELRSIEKRIWVRHENGANTQSRAESLPQGCIQRHEVLLQRIPSVDARLSIRCRQDEPDGRTDRNRTRVTLRQPFLE